MLGSEKIASQKKMQKLLGILEWRFNHDAPRTRLMVF